MIRTVDDVRRSFSPADIAGLTVYGEARGEPVEGQIAVLNVIRNRATFKAMSLADICLEPAQFACWWPDGGEQETLFTMVNTYQQTPALVGPILLQCLALAELVQSRVLLDNTLGATFYLTRAAYQVNRPAWANGRTPICSYGHHLFFRNIAPYLDRNTPPPLKSA